MNNADISRADRTTHMKIVAVSLAASTLVLAVAVSARSFTPQSTQAVAHGPVLKATKAVVTTANDVTIIR